MLENLNFIEPIQDITDDMTDYARVVLVDLTKVSHKQALSFEPYLDATEQQKLHIITNEKKRHAFVVCRFVAKQLIGEFFGRNPLTLNFQCTRRGKPYLATPDLATPEVEFNISHSGDFALIGVSRHKIGVDIEKIKANRNFKGLANAVLSDAEKHWVFEHDTKRRFYQLWTLKEARLKCDGEGLAGHFPAATYNIASGWSYDEYKIITNFVKNEYVYTICIDKAKKQVT